MRIEEKILEALRKRAEEEGVSRGELVRRAIKHCYMRPKVWSTR